MVLMSSRTEHCPQGLVSLFQLGAWARLFCHTVPRLPRPQTSRAYLSEAENSVWQMGFTVVLINEKAIKGRRENYWEQLGFLGTLTELTGENKLFQASIAQKVCQILFSTQTGMVSAVCKMGLGW